MRFFWGFLLCLWVQGNAWGSDKTLPPVGKRAYLIEVTKPASPAAIIEKGEVSQVEGVTIMKDPIPLGGKPILLKPQSQTQTSVAPKPKQISKIVFDKMPVKGRYSVPRVSFDRPQADIKRRDESVIVDYKKRVKESEASFRNYEW